METQSTFPWKQVSLFVNRAKPKKLYFFPFCFCLVLALIIFTVEVRVNLYSLNIERA